MAYSVERPSCLILKGISRRFGEVIEVKSSAQAMDIYVPIPINLKQARERSWTCQLVLAVILWPLMFYFGIWALKEHRRVEAVSKYPIVEGVIIDGYRKKINWMVTRPYLTIQIKGEDTTVNALLMQNGIADFPRNVSFHYSGNPNEEVYLEQESNPLHMVWFFFGLPTVLSIVLLFIHFVILPRRYKDDPIAEKVRVKTKQV